MTAIQKKNDENYQRSTAAISVNEHQRINAQYDPKVELTVMKALLRNNGSSK